jgi:hypothetical protein
VICDWLFQLSRVGKSWNYTLIVYNMILALSISLKLDFGNPNYIVQLHLAKVMHPWIQGCNNGSLELITKWPQWGTLGAITSDGVKVWRATRWLDNSFAHKNAHHPSKMHGRYGHALAFFFSSNPIPNELSYSSIFSLVVLPQQKSKKCFK